MKFCSCVSYALKGMCVSAVLSLRKIKGEVGMPEGLAEQRIGGFGIFLIRAYLQLCYSAVPAFLCTNEQVLEEVCCLCGSPVAAGRGLAHVTSRLH